MSLWFAGSLILTVVAWAGWFALYFGGMTFPEKTPIHWNIDMQPDGWVAGRTAPLWLLPMPALMLLLLGLNVMLPRWSPTAFQEPGMRTKLDFILCTTSAFFVVLTFLIARGMSTTELPIKPFLMAFFVLFGVLGWSMRGLKRNKWIGVRTPWTLRSDAVWTRTHDFAAKVWMAVGVVGVICVLASAPPWVCLVLLLPAVLAPLVASYLYSRMAQ